MSAFHRRPVALLLLSAATLLACEQEPFAATGDPASGTAALRAVVASPATFQPLVDAQRAAWDAHDADAFAALYTIDAGFYDPVGNVVVGRDAIRGLHAMLFAGPFMGSSETQVITGVRMLTGTIAVVNLEATLTGYAALPPTLIPTEPGTVRTTKTWVLMKRGGRWEILTQHMAPIAPAAP